MNKKHTQKIEKSTHKKCFKTSIPNHVRVSSNSVERKGEINRKQGGGHFLQIRELSSSAWGKAHAGLVGGSFRRR